MTGLPVQSAGPSPNSRFIRDPEFWYSEGNIILLIKDPTGKPQITGLRLFRDLLSKESQVFRDMFELSSAPAKGSSGTLKLISPKGEGDGEPVVTLDDPIEDLRSTFRLLWGVP